MVHLLELLSAANDLMVASLEDTGFELGSRNNI